jgi:hypothetical protein
MDKEKVADWIQIVGLFAVIASLIFVGYELRQTGLVATEESLLSEEANVTSMQSLVVENADVWLRGCMGEELEPTERMVFTRIYHTYVFRQFYTWMRTREAISVGSGSLGVAHMAANLYRNPGFQREWRQHGEWRRHVPDEAIFQVWRRLVEDRLKDMPGIEPTPVLDPYRCGLN